MIASFIGAARIASFNFYTKLYSIEENLCGNKWIWSVCHNRRGNNQTEIYSGYGNALPNHFSPVPAIIGEIWLAYTGIQVFHTFKCSGLFH